MSTEYIDPADCPRDTMYRGVVRGRTHILRRVSPGEPKPWIAILSDWDYSEHADGEISHLVEVGMFPPLSTVSPPKGTATPEEVEKILKREMGRIRPETIDLKSENARRVAEIINHEGFGSGGTLGELVAARLEEEGLIAPAPLREGVEEAYQRGHEDGYWSGKTTDMSPAQAASFMAPYRSRCPGCVDRAEGDGRADQ